MKAEFNTALFLQVYKSNIKTISNSMSNAADVAAVMIGSPLMTEQEVREYAVACFQKQLAKELYEYLKTK
jgi:hypothetical protein